MALLKDLRQHKRSIVAIHKLTSAMKLVSSAKFIKQQQKWHETKVALEKLEDIAGRLHTQMFRLQRPNNLIKVKDPHKPTLLVIFSSDKGLCGGFNVRLLKTAQSMIADYQERLVPLKILCVGQKSVQAMGALPSVVGCYTFLSGQMEDFLPVIQDIEERYRTGDIDNCVVLYNAFYNALRQEPKAVDILPMALAHHHEGEIVAGGLLEYAPSFDAVLDSTLSLLLKNQLYALFKEHLVSEHGARMAAMGAATDSAKDLMQSLTLKYNRLRQSSITTELIEIISGAEAL